MNINLKSRKVRRAFGIKGKRTSAGIHRVLALGPHIGRARRTTGQPDWFRELEMGIFIKAHLKKLPVSALVEKGLPANIAAALERAGFATLWDLSKAKAEDLLAIPKMGPKTLSKLARLLRENKIEPKWAAE